MNYDAVVIEDLDMKGMSQALTFGKSVADNGWGCSSLFFTVQAKRTKETTCQNR